MFVNKASAVGSLWAPFGPPVLLAPLGPPGVARWSPSLGSLLASRFVGLAGVPPGSQLPPLGSPPFVFFLLSLVSAQPVL